jgi:phage-related protein
MRREIIGIILVLAVIAGSIGVISAQKHFGMQAPAEGHQWFGSAGWMSQLTEGQRDDVRLQMHDFQQQICDQYNLSCPGAPLSNLTDEERADVRQQMRMFQRGQRNDTRDFRQQICDQYNLSCPGSPLSNLTEEERAEVQQEIQEFRRGQRNDSRDFRESQNQEAEEFWQRISDQYNITDSIGPKFMYGIPCS